MSDVRLIDAVALEKLFEEECAGECPICSYSHEGCPCGFIRTVPTVEAYTKDDMTKEYLKGYNACKDIIQPKGEWIEITNGRGGHECNLCGEYAPNYQSGREYLSAFCPNCGAKMKREEE